jgi:hypothetical protein
MGCIETPGSAAAWGPFVEFDSNSEFTDLNFGGCIAKLDPSAAGQKCGTAYEELEQCYDEACFESCASNLTAFSACTQLALGSRCSSFQDAVDIACAEENAVTEKCDALVYGGYQDGGVSEATAYLALFCEVPSGGG